MRSLICLSVMVGCSLSVPSCGRDGELLPDLDCSRFLKCHNGIPTSLACPAGLRFNPQISACDWPDAVPCQEEDALVSGARMVWQRENAVTNHNQRGNILEMIYSQDKLQARTDTRVEGDVKPVGQEGR